MLCELYIENLAIIEKTSIKFDNGFNVFTGETGAGKSIVIDAINAVLGQRTSKEIVRHNTPKATIVASFSEPNHEVLAKLLELGYEIGEDQLIITREISADGKSSARVQGKPITVGMLKEIGTLLINIHGQHDNQVLLAPEKHIDILDKYGELEQLSAEYYSCYRSVVLIKREMKRLAVDEREKAEKIDLLTYQIDEIVNALFTDDEEQQLLARRTEIKNHTKIIQALNTCYMALNGQNDDGGATGLLKQGSDSILDIVDIYEPISEIATKLEGIYYEVDELAGEVANLLESMDINKGEIEIVESRLDEIHRIKRKYGETASEVSSFLENAQAELLNLELSDKRILELNEQGTKEYERLLSLANKLTDGRKKASERFLKAVTSELVFLDMPNVRLEVSLTHQKPNAKGQDVVEFMISTNKGEPPKPIAKIASGGELSRIMLAIKNSLADKDEIQTLIFDEIDTGVSGRAAQKIGLKLKEAAKNRQIISVTHLAQIAALADHHFLIKKQSDNDNTFTNVQKLDLDGRVQEVARIMSTDKISDLMLENAREMIMKKSVDK